VTNSQMGVCEIWLKSSARCTPPPVERDPRDNRRYSGPYSKAGLSSVVGRNSSRSLTAKRTSPMQSLKRFGLTSATLMLKDSQSRMVSKGASTSSMTTKGMHPFKMLSPAREDHPSPVAEDSTGGVVLWRCYLRQAV
jgi:hypothetical protein